MPDTSLPRLLDRLGTDTPRVCVVDSIQTIHDPASGSSPGSITQVRDCAHQLVAAAKDLRITMVLVGHVTKEGALAGPRVLEHIVDTVLTLDGDRHGELRILRAAKHRFGSTQEIGLFAITGAGFISVDDPSEMFLADRRPGIPGSVVVPALDGRRPMLVEVQALVARTQLPQARRSAQGLDGGRLNLLLAVLARRMEIPTSGSGRLRDGGRGSEDLRTGCGSCSVRSGDLIDHERRSRGADGPLRRGGPGRGTPSRRADGTTPRRSRPARFTTAVVPRSAPRSHPDIEVLAVPSLDAALTVAGVVPDDM
ncbi:MAG: hypothetical protein M5U19_01745 [Microthrixaceae bacterium]|nr:hypothetical protein [Microthrixaceae bacterium]